MIARFRTVAAYMRWRRFRAFYAAKSAFASECLQFLTTSLSIKQCQVVFQSSQPSIQSVGKSSSLRSERFLRHVRALSVNSGYASFIRSRTAADHFVTEMASSCAQEAAMMNRAPHDLAQDVAAAFVGRQNAVRDQKCCCSRMVGDDAQRSGAAFAFFE